MLATLTVVGIVVLAVLAVVFMRARRSDFIDEILTQKKPTSKVATKADHVEGIERMPVALYLANDTIYYQNSDLDASFELSMVEEIEYDDELTTGRQVEPACRALRLRSHGRAIEFVVTERDAQLWMAALKPRRSGEPAAQAV